MLNGNNCCHTITHICTGKIDVLFFQDIQLTRIIVNNGREHGLESGQMHTTLSIVYIITKSKNIFMEFIYILKCTLYSNAITASTVINDVMNCFFIFIKVFHITNDTFRFLINDFFRSFESLIAKYNCKLGIQISSLMQTALNFFCLKPGLVKYRRIRCKVDSSSCLSGLTDNRKQTIYQFYNRIAIFIFILMNQSTALYCNCKLCRQRIHN